MEILKGRIVVQKIKLKKTILSYFYVKSKLIQLNIKEIVIEVPFFQLLHKNVIISLSHISILTKSSFHKKSHGKAYFKRF